MLKRLAVASLLLGMFFAGASRLAAQAPAGSYGSKTPGAADEHGLTARVALQGNSSPQGQVFVLNSSTGWVFNKYFNVGLGVPIYFVHATTPSTGSTAAPGTSSSGDLGDFYGVIGLNLDNPVAAYSTSLTFTAPTGDQAKGRSTGQMTYDWDNRLDHQFFDHLTPYVDAGLANSLSSTRLYYRPFLTYGNVAHFEVGTDIKLAKPLTVTLAAYDILPWGTQHVFSRFVRPGSLGSGPPSWPRNVYEVNAETIGTAALTQDNGYSVGVGISPSRIVDFSLGWTHSVPQHLDTISFGIGFNISRMFRRSTLSVERKDSGDATSAKR